MLGLTTLLKKLALRQSSPSPESPAQGEGEEQVQLRRRRLIKGAAASAPMILTLYNGAAFARSSIVVTEANNYAELFDAEKDIGNPICVTAERFDPTGAPGNLHVYNGQASFMQCKGEQNTGNREGPCDHPPQDEVDKKQQQFKEYEQNCETEIGGVLIVASSSASLIH